MALSSAIRVSITALELRYKKDFTTR